MSELSEWDYGAHWVSQQVEHGVFGISNPVAVGVLKFGLPWNILAAVYTVVSWDQISSGFLVASALGLLWVNLAPTFIWSYDQVVLPRFFARADEIVESPAELTRLAKKYTRFFAQHRISVSVFWGAIFCGIIYASRDVLLSQGMGQFGGVFLWTTYLYALFIGAVLAHGFVGPITTILLIRELSETDLNIDPLHPDNLGGLSNVGYCAIRTTLLFSTGSLFLPLLFRFTAGGAAPEVILTAVFVYIFTVLASFVYPTIRMNRRAQELREERLDDLRKRYYSELETVDDPDQSDISELNRRLEIQQVQREYENLNNVRLYPLQINILIRLAGSVLLPLAFVFIEFYIPRVI